MFLVLFFRMGMLSDRLKFIPLRYLLLSLGLLGCGGSASLAPGPVAVGETWTLAPCGTKPNCVSSSGGAEHLVQALRLGGTKLDRSNFILATLSNAYNCTVLENKELSDGSLYIHLAIRTPVFRFIDDMELLIGADLEPVQIRSSSRVGHSDLGVNRKRVETLRKAIRDSRFKVD